MRTPSRIKQEVARRRSLLAAAAILCLFAFAGHARATGEHEIKAAPGREVRAGIYIDIRADCTSGPLPAIRLAVAPAHGVVNVRRGRLKATNFRQCLATEVPAFVVYYRAAKGFIGTDRFQLEIGAPDGRKRLERFRVNVSGAGGKPGI